MASLLTILSLNTNKRVDLGGLHSVLKETKPHLVFLQEVCSYNAVSALVASFGYTLTASTLRQASRDLIIATLSRLPATVQEVQPGRVQLVTVGALPFLNIHADSNDLLASFTSLRPHLDSPISPVLVGDFNCVQDPLDYTPGGHIGPPCYSLGRILRTYSYTDSFRSLHLTSRIYSFHHRGMMVSRLDRAYLPPLLESHPRVAGYIPTSSEHHAYLLRPETAGLALMPSLSPRAASNSLYWKFNSSLLADPNFLPAFRAMWLLLAAARPLLPVPDPAQPDPDLSVTDVPVPVPVPLPAAPEPALVTRPPPPGLPLDERTPPQIGPDPVRRQPNWTRFFRIRIYRYFPIPDPHTHGPPQWPRCSYLSSPLHPCLPTPPPLAPARPDWPPRVARPLNPSAPAPVFIPAQPANPPPQLTPDPPRPWTWTWTGPGPPPPPPEAADWWDQVAKRQCRLSPLPPSQPGQQIPGAGFGGLRLACCGGRSSPPSIP